MVGADPPRGVSSSRPGGSGPERAILELVEQRGIEKTACPSEAARLLAADGEDFRAHMGAVLAAARSLVAAGRIEVLQKGQVVDLDGARGPVRLRTTRPPD